MENVKSRLSEKTAKKNGVYVHYSPPKLLDVVTSVQLRRWARGGADKKLERAILAGQGHRLLTEVETWPLAQHIPALVLKCDALHTAVERGSLLELKEHLEADYNRRKTVMCRDEAGVGLLHKAVYYDYVDIVEWLVKNYPHLVHQKDSEGRTPLHYVCLSRRAGYVSALLEQAGAARGARDFTGRTPAQYRAAPRHMLTLPAPRTDMPRDPPVNSQGLLVVKRSNIRIWCHDCDMSRLQRVLWEGHGSRLLNEISSQPVVKKFLEAVPYIMNTIREIHNDVLQNDLESLMKHTGDPVPPQILSSRDPHNMTVLHKAAGLGHASIVKYILDRYPSGINDVDNDGRTPLHYAAIVKDDQHTFNTLVSYGADEGVVDNKNRTPGYYINRPQEIDKNVIKILPEAPRTASNAYPSSWDWKLLDLDVTTEISKKSRKKKFNASSDNISYKNNTNSLSENTNNHENGMKPSSTREFIKELPDLNEAINSNKIITKETEVADEVEKDVDAEIQQTADTELPAEIKTASENIQDIQPIDDERDVTEEKVEDAVIQPTDDGAETTSENNHDDTNENPDKHNNLESKSDEEVEQLDLNNIDTEVINSHIEEEINLEKVETAEIETKHIDVNETMNETNNESSSDKVCEVTPETGPLEETKIDNDNESTSRNGEHLDDYNQSEKRNNEISDLQEEDQNFKLSPDKLSLEIENIDKESDEEIKGNFNKKEDDDDVQVQGDNRSEYSDTNLKSTAELSDTGSAKRGNVTKGQNTQESLIEGLISGKSEQESEDASIVNRNGFANRNAFEVDNEIDPEVTELINTSNMEMLAALVLNGEGSRLIGRRSANSEIQAFLDNVPVYMQKINKIHLAAKEGNIRDLQAALDRRKFAIARDPVSTNGATPLHVATLFGKTNIVKYLGGRFPETLSAVDFEGRTALHYAAVIPDNGHYFNLLQQLGANSKDLDDNGRSADEYLKHPSFLPYQQLLADFGINEDTAQEMLCDKSKSRATVDGHMDIPIFHTEEGRYLAKSLGDPLIKGLTEVANVKPKDPIAFLASFLHNFPEREKINLGMEESNVEVADEEQDMDSEKTPQRAVQPKSNAIPLETSAHVARPVPVLAAVPSTLKEERAPRPIDVVAVDPRTEQSPDAPENAFSSTTRDEHGQSMLHFAAARSHTKNALFQLLQESDISIAYRDELYRTARDISIQANIPENTADIDRWVLHLAARGNTNKIMELVLEGYDHILDLTDEGVSITDLIEQRGDTDMANLLSSIPSFEESREILHAAIKHDDLKTVTGIVASEGGKTLARSKNSFGRTALHVAVLLQHEDIVSHLAETCTELLRVGDNLERTPLHYAMGVEKMESLSRILIKAGAKRVLKDLKGRQPSYYFMNKSDILRLREEEVDDTKRK